jgi:outer membrane biosynthesis protein TonB
MSTAAPVAILSQLAEIGARRDSSESPVIAPDSPLLGPGGDSALAEVPSPITTEAPPPPPDPPEPAPEPQSEPEPAPEPEPESEPEPVFDEPPPGGLAAESLSAARPLPEPFTRPMGVRDEFSDDE